MKIDPVTLKLGWARLIALVDDCAAVLMRGAFSSLVREMHDFSVCLLDERGRLLVTSSLGGPSFAAMLPIAVKHFVELFPIETLRPGDALITNDPWIATGHLHDFTVAEPIFHDGTIVAWAACAAHIEDIGGLGATIRAREVYEEGLFIPPCKVMEAGTPNDLLFNIIRAAVRTPESVLGDLRSQIATTRVMSRKISEILTGLKWKDLRGLADDLLDRTERTTRDAIAQIPDGRFEKALLIDSYKTGVPPLRLAVAITIQGDELSMDFSGTSGQVDWGINAPFNLIRGYGFFPLKCVLDPSMPLNDGFTRPIRVSAPEGCILNARRPAPVWGRMLVGYFLSELIFEALAAVIPERVVAASGGVPQWLNFFDTRKPDGTRVLTPIVPQGGMGARSFKDGVSTLSWPANLAMIPIEIFEHETGLLCEAMEFVSDSAGAGKYRGGLGQRLVLSVPTGYDGSERSITVSVRGGRLKFPGSGLLGGLPTPFGSVRLNNEEIEEPMQRQFKTGDRITYMVPGGAGFYAPFKRDPELVAVDVRDGYVTRQMAEEIYGVRLTSAGEVDTKETANLRQGHLEASQAQNAAATN